MWCGWRGSNPRPLASEANTLSTELQPHRHLFYWPVDPVSFTTRLPNEKNGPRHVLDAGEEAGGIEYPSDYAKLIKTAPGAEAYMSKAESKCALWK